MNQPWMKVMLALAAAYNILWGACVILWPNALWTLRSTFCREALADLARCRQAIEGRGVMLVLVHMSTDEQAQRYLSPKGMADAHRISDTQRRVYRALGLERGRLWQLFRPVTWWRGSLALLKGHGIGRLAGDGFQMPGAFLLYRGKLIKAFRHRTAADKPNYVGIGTCTI